MGSSSEARKSMPQQRAYHFSTLAEFWFIAFLVVVSFGVLLVILAYRALHPRAGDDVSAILAMLALLVVVPAASLLFFACSTTGSGQIDLNRIRYKPLLGRPRVLSWQEIECIQWTRAGAGFRSPRVTLQLRWQWFRPQDQCEVQEFVRERLERDFDLTLSNHGQRHSWRRIMVLMAPLLILVLVPYFYLLRHPHGRFAAPAVFALIIPGVIPYAILLIRGWRNRKHPSRALCWRSRIS